MGGFQIGFQPGRVAFVTNDESVRPVIGKFFKTIVSRLRIDAANSNAAQSAAADRTETN
jgi:hypothetical protein